MGEIMEINREEAIVILNLIELVWGEGLDVDGDDALVDRILGQFPGLERPSDER